MLQLKKRGNIALDPRGPQGEELPHIFRSFQKGLLMETRLSLTPDEMSAPKVPRGGMEDGNTTIKILRVWFGIRRHGGRFNQLLYTPADLEIPFRDT
jgi:hypothetical protein